MLLASSWQSLATTVQDKSRIWNVQLLLESGLERVRLASDANSFLRRAAERGCSFAQLPGADAVASLLLRVKSVPQLVFAVQSSAESRAIAGRALGRNLSDGAGIERIERLADQGLREAACLYQASATLEDFQEPCGALHMARLAYARSRESAA